MKHNKTKYAILGLLSHEPLTGYDIKKKIESTISYFWDASFGQIYPTLQKLANDGLVIKKVELEENRPVRKIYSITEKGIEELRKWLREPVEKEVIRYEILLKLSFGSQISIVENLKNIKEFQYQRRPILEILKGYEQNLKQVIAQNEDHLYYLLTVRFGEYVYQAYQDWAEEAIKLLESRLSGEDADGR